MEAQRKQKHDESSELWFVWEKRNEEIRKCLEVEWDYAELLEKQKRDAKKEYL